jgi:DNA polymerase-3 subunit delta
MRDARVWGERARVMPKALRRCSSAQLAQALAHAARIDRMAKGLARGDVWDELRQLGLRIAAPETAGRLPVPAG